MPWMGYKVYQENVWLLKNNLIYSYITTIHVNWLKLLEGDVDQQLRSDWIVSKFYML